MESKIKSDFGKLCRELRVQNRYKQREVAEKIGVKTSTYGNLESSPYKVVGIDKVNRMVELYGLSESTKIRHVDLVDAWQRCPLSEYGEKQRKTWERRNKMRSKAKHHDRMMRSLAEVLGSLLPVYVDHVGEANVCACSFDRDEPCEVCLALENLGLDRFTTLELAIRQIAGLQDKLEAARAAAQNGATP